MANYLTLTTTRTSAPDTGALEKALGSIEVDISFVLVVPGSYRFKKATVWTAGQIASTQTALDTTPALTPQRQAQNEIDQWPLAQKALVLALIDQLNFIRSKLVPPLPAITPAQALAGIRDKAATL